MRKFLRSQFARLDGRLARYTLMGRIRALLLVWQVGLLLVLLGIYIYTTFSLGRQISHGRLDDEISLAQERLAEWGETISLQARFIAQMGGLAQAVSAGDRSRARDLVVESIRFFDVDNVDVVNLDGVSLVEIHRIFGAGFDVWGTLFREAVEGRPGLSIVTVPAGVGEAPHYLLMSAVPLRDDGGDVVGAVLVGNSLDAHRLETLLFARRDVYAALYQDTTHWIGDESVIQENPRLEKVLRNEDDAQRALQTGTPAVRLFPLLPGLGPYVSAYIPVPFESDSPWVLALVIDVTDLLVTRRITVLWFGLSVVAGLMVLQSLLLRLVRHTVVVPLELMAEASAAFAKGRYDLTVPAFSSGAMRKMVNNFNQMAAAVRERDARLREFARTLETQVAERTAELQRMETAVLAAANAVVITDAEGSIRWVNPAFERLTGYSAEEAIGENPRLLRSGMQSPDFYRQMWETIRAGQVWRGELVNRRKDGSLYVEHMTIAPVRDANGVITDYIAIKEDITEYRRLVDELQRAREKAEAANRAKSQFLANMSHEFRTPLTAIVGYSELLEEDIRDMGYTELIPDVRNIREAGNHLASLVDAVLDLAKIEAGYMQLDVHPFSVDGVLQAVVATVEPLFAKSGNRLEISAQPNMGEMTADPIKTRQILINLLSNANKFTQQGTVTLRSRRFADENGKPWVEFQVQDTGIGMTQEQLGRIFNEFVQVDPSVTRKFGGTGLGLSVSKHFCEMMGGVIFAESAVGEGSTFTVRLPAEVVSLKGETNEPKN